MRVRELIKMIHQNAVDHGWWEEDRELGEVLALIHSEWSEALEEYRNDRPLVWYKADIENSCWRKNGCIAHITFGACSGQYSAAEHETGGCPFGMKPEGQAVELIDGVIRILDYLGRCMEQDMMPDVITEADISTLSEPIFNDENDKMLEELSFPCLITTLHVGTDLGVIDDESSMILSLWKTANMAMYYVKHLGLDPEAVLLEKHRYNVTRPYRHGNKKC